MRLFVHILFIFSAWRAVAYPPEQGFALEAPLKESTIHYKKYNNLIILSARINDTLQVNLILDTGGRNIVLFGRRFLKCFQVYEPRPIRFSGLGEKKPISGQLTLGNSVSLEGVSGKRIPIVVVPSRNIFAGIGTIDGVIGIDLLSRFELEVNPMLSTITFRCAMKSTPRDWLITHALDPDEVLPQVSGNILAGDHEETLPLLIDTGSVLGLLYKSPDAPVSEEAVGMGYCGILFGERATCHRLKVNGVELAAVLEMTIARQNRDNCLSIGMGFLKDYVFIINKVQGYFQLSRPPLMGNPVLNPREAIIARMY